MFVSVLDAEKEVPHCGFISIHVINFELFVSLYCDYIIIS